MRCKSTIQSRLRGVGRCPPRGCCAIEIVRGGGAGAGAGLAKSSVFRFALESTYKDYEQTQRLLSYHFRFGEPRAELETAMIRGSDRARTLSTPFRLHFYYDPTGILYESSSWGNVK